MFSGNLNSITKKKNSGGRKQRGEHNGEGALTPQHQTIKSPQRHLELVWLWKQPLLSLKPSVTLLKYIFKNRKLGDFDFLATSPFLVNCQPDRELWFTLKDNSRNTSVSFSLKCPWFSETATEPSHLGSSSCPTDDPEMRSVQRMKVHLAFVWVCSWNGEENSPWREEQLSPWWGTVD